MNRRTLRAAALLGAAWTLAYSAQAAGAVGDPERDPTADGIGYHVYPSLAAAKLESTPAVNQETPGDIEVLKNSPLRFTVVAYASSQDPNSRWYNRTRRVFLEDGTLADLKTAVTQAGQRIIDLERVNAGGVSWAAVTVQSGFLPWDALAGTPRRTFRRLQQKKLWPIDVDRGFAVGLTSDPALYGTPPTEWRIGWDRATIEKHLYELRDRKVSLSDVERNPDGGFDVLFTYDRRNPLLRPNHSTQRVSIRRALFIGTLANLKERVNGGARRILDIEVPPTPGDNWMALLAPN
jgi:hypothetical protein